MAPGRDDADRHAASLGRNEVRHAWSESGSPAAYDRTVTVTVPETRTRPALVAARDAPSRIATSRLTGRAMWRGVTGIYHGNHLTFASSIAYYSLLSLFPFFLLVFSIIASVTSSDADRTDRPQLRAPLLPAPVRVRDRPSSTR